MPKEKLAILPNFVPERPWQAASKPTAWLLAGRISPEKGSVDLLKAWPPEIPLHVVGAGPDDDEAREVAPNSVEFLGSVPPDTLRGMMRDHIGLVFPSKWREHSPLVYLEALEAGLPVVALRGSWPADDIEVEGLGRVLDELSVENLREAIEIVTRERSQLTYRCRHSFLQRFSEVQWTNRLLHLYEAALVGGDR